MTTKPSPFVDLLAESQAARDAEGYTPDEILGEHIHVLLRRRGLSQKMLALHLNVTQTTVSNKLKGIRPWTLNDIVKTAAFLGMPPFSLLELPRLDSNQQPSGYPFLQLVRAAA